MIENFNGGYLALVIVGVVFFALQFWWLSMTIRNGRNDRVEIREDHMAEIKKRLETIFSKPD